MILESGLIDSIAINHSLIMSCSDERHTREKHCDRRLPRTISVIRNRRVCKTVNYRRGDGKLPHL